MIRLVLVSLFALVLFPCCVEAADPLRVFELREETAIAGKLNMLQARLRERMPRLFEKHGITHVATWVPVQNVDNRLYYLVGWQDRKSRELSLAAWNNDPAIKAMMADTDKQGKLLAKGEITPLVMTHYSPIWKAEKKGDRIFELRVYTATPTNLANLNTRFRDHTLQLFTKHGMTNIAYWTPIVEQGQLNDRLFCLLAHPSVEASKSNIAAFQADPTWLKVKADSERKAGGLLTAKDGIKSVLLKPTDDSPLK